MCTNFSSSCSVLVHSSNPRRALLRKGRCVSSSQTARRWLVGGGGEGKPEGDKNWRVGIGAEQLLGEVLNLSEVEWDLSAEAGGEEEGRVWNGGDV